MKIFKWNEDKNIQIKHDRGVSFEIAVRHIQDNDILDIIDHPNSKRYPNQRIYVLHMNDYVYYVPFVEQNDEIFLKNIIPSRKMKKKYESEDSNEKN